MKKILVLIAVFAIAQLPSTAQNAALAQFFETYKNTTGFTHAYLSKDLLELANQTDIPEHDWKKLHQVVRNIGSLQLLAAENIQNGPELYKEAKSIIPTDDFDELLSVKEEQDRVNIWTRDYAGNLTDLVILAGTSDAFVLVSFVGELNLQNAMDLVDMFHAAEVTQLAKTANQINAAFSVSPNPSQGIFQLNFTEPDDQPQVLSLIDQQGRVVYNQDLNATNTQTITCPQLPSGTYWAQVKSVKGKIGIKQIQLIK